MVMLRRLLPFVFVVTLIVLSASEAFAAAKLYGLNHVGQYTAYSNGHEYFGWHGIKGYMYLRNAPILFGISPYIDPGGHKHHPHVSHSLGIKTSGNRWIQSGVVRETGFNNNLTCYYTENVWGTDPYTNRYFDIIDYAAVPGTLYRQLTFHHRDTSTGYYVWRQVVYAGGGYNEYYLDHATGEGQAMSESYNTSAVNDIGDMYWGTNKVGYNNSSYALYLRNYKPAWELWDTSLMAHTTGVWANNNPPYRYSPGKNYYYFGTWNN